MKDFKVPDTQWLKGFRAANSLANKEMAKLESQLADATAEYKEYHRLFGVERKAKRKLQTQLDAVREIASDLTEPDDWRGQILQAIQEK